MDHADPRARPLSGLRSDSDMFTMGFPFRPWTANKAIADGADIYDYVRETAEEYGELRRARSYASGLAD